MYTVPLMSRHSWYQTCDSVIIHRLQRWRIGLPVDWTGYRDKLNGNKHDRHCGK
jgi:hypothetical protein